MIDKSKILTGISCLFGGIILGFLFAPMKNGVDIKIGNNSGNKSFGKEEDVDIFKSLKE